MFYTCLVGGGSCDFQTSFRGGSLNFVPNGRGGSCVFYLPHFQMLRPLSPPPLPPYAFWPVPFVENLLVLMNKVERTTRHDILYLFGQGNLLFIREKAGNFKKWCLLSVCVTIKFLYTNFALPLDKNLAYFIICSFCSQFNSYAFLPAEYEGKKWTT